MTRLVDELAHPNPPVIGVMSSLPLAGNPQMMMQGQGQPGQPGGPSDLLSRAREGFPRRTGPARCAGDRSRSIQVLLLAQAQNLSQPTLYAIDQFVMRGGRLMVMVDPYSEAEANTRGPEGIPSVDNSSTLEPLLADWGIAYNPSQVVCDLTGAIEVQANNSDQVAGVLYVAWFNIRRGISTPIPPLRTSPRSPSPRPATSPRSPAPTSLSPRSSNRARNRKSSRSRK